MGPLLFIIYINDIVNCVKHCKLYQFADDTSIFFNLNKNNNNKDLINEDLEAINIWFKSNKLSLNPNKTKYIIFRSRQKPLPKDITITIDKIQISQVTEIKFLGIILNEHLDWGPHINMIRLKISKSIGIICHIKRLINISLLITLYNSLILPYLMYCNVLWGKTYQTKLEKLKVLQRKFIRTTLNMGRRETIALRHLKDLNLLMVDDIIKLSIGIYMYKTKNLLFPSFYKNPVKSSARMYNTRFNHYYIAFCRTNIAKEFITYTGPLLWNTIDDIIKNKYTLHQFRNSYKSQILGGYT